MNYENISNFNITYWNIGKYTKHSMYGYRKLQSAYISDSNELCIDFTMMCDFFFGSNNAQN